MSDRVQVTRILVYEGPEEWVQNTLNKNYVKGRIAVSHDKSITEVFRSDTGIITEEKSIIGCVACGEPHTDLSYIHTGLIDSNRIFHIGFPVCDLHNAGDMSPDQYVMNGLVVEVDESIGGLM